MAETITRGAEQAYRREPFFCDTMLDAFETEVERATSADRLCTVLARNLGNLGFDHFAYIRFSEAEDGTPAAHVLTQYPLAWRERYVAARHFGSDPALWHTVGRVTPITWYELAEFEAPSERSAAILEEARSHGLCNGVATPLHSAGRTFAVLNAATDLDGYQAVELIRRFRNMVHMMSSIFHAHAERCMQAHALTLPTARISDPLVRKMLHRSL